MFFVLFFVTCLPCCFIGSYCNLPFLLFAFLLCCTFLLQMPGNRFLRPLVKIIPETRIHCDNADLQKLSKDRHAMLCSHP